MGCTWYRDTILNWFIGRASHEWIRLLNSPHAYLQLSARTRHAARWRQRQALLQIHTDKQLGRINKLQKENRHDTVTVESVEGSKFLCWELKFRLFSCDSVTDGHLVHILCTSVKLPVVHILTSDWVRASGERRKQSMLCTEQVSGRFNNFWTKVSRRYTLAKKLIKLTVGCL